MIKSHETRVPMTGVNREIPATLVSFSGPYQAAAQGIDHPQHERQAPFPMPFRIGAIVEMLSRFLAEWKI